MIKLLCFFFYVQETHVINEIIIIMGNKLKSISFIDIINTDDN